MPLLLKLPSELLDAVNHELGAAAFLKFRATCTELHALDHLMVPVNLGHRFLSLSSINTRKLIWQKAALEDANSALESADLRQQRDIVLLREQAEVQLKSNLGYLEVIAVANCAKEAALKEVTKLKTRHAELKVCLRLARAVLSRLVQAAMLSSGSRTQAAMLGRRWQSDAWM